MLLCNDPGSHGHLLRGMEEFASLPSVACG